MANTCVVGGHTVRFERRVYPLSTGGSQFFCWVYVKTGPDEWVQLGDPWPCSRPKNTEILEAIAVNLQPSQARCPYQEKPSQ